MIRRYKGVSTIIQKLKTDALLKEKYVSAKKGLSAWKKLERDIKLKSDDVVILQPDGDSDEAIYSLTCLHQLILTVRPNRIFIFTTNPDMKIFAGLFSREAEVRIIDQTMVQDMMNYALMIMLKPNIYIASLTKPFGRWGDRLIDAGIVGSEHCFAVGVYRVWRYIPEKLPIYTESDERIISFLNRAEVLRKNSIQIDMEARAKYE